MVYGKPIEMDELRKAKASVEKVTELIMSEIDKLIKEHQEVLLDKIDYL